MIQEAVKGSKTRKRDPLFMEFPIQINHEASSLVVQPKKQNEEAKRKR